MEDFMSDKELPSYGILSHTWGKEEVSYHDLVTRPSVENEPNEGYSKISRFCQQASDDGLEWVWADTAELSEAINSMFRWYRNAACCYVYLADVSTAQQDDPGFKASFSNSRWFIRGWTLQELIAPKKLVFYSQDWSYIGTKVELCSLISTVTRIGEEYLLSKDVGMASISYRMSWASRRQTSRTEDIAYCLLGIFDVNMPLLYGEGIRAFQRLQEIIMQTLPEDHTLFAWGKVVDKVSWLCPREKVMAAEAVEWGDGDEHPAKLGLLAGSPADFEDSGGFVPTTCALLFYHHVLINAKPPLRIGREKIQVQLPVFMKGDHWLQRWRRLPQIAQVSIVWYVVLLCGSEGDFVSTVAVPVAMSKYNDFGSRSRELVRIEDPRSTLPLIEAKRSISISVPLAFALQPNDIVMRRQFIEGQTIGGGGIDFNRGIQGVIVPFSSILRCNVDAGPVCRIKIDMLGTGRGFYLELCRVPAVAATEGEGEGEGGKYALPGLSAGLIPFRDARALEGTVNGIEWHLIDDIRRYPPDSCSLFRHTFSCPGDEWTVNWDLFPRVYLRVEKICFDKDKNHCVDVLDLVISEHPPASARSPGGSQRPARSSGVDKRLARSPGVKSASGPITRNQEPEIRPTKRKRPNLQRGKS